MAPESLKMLSDSLSFHYVFQNATTAPSKLTATQLKGRIKDLESSENTWNYQRSIIDFRKPSFIGEHTTAAGYGTTMHAVMQYLNFDACRNNEGIRMELIRIGEEQLISSEQLTLVNSRKIETLFSSKIGNKMMECRHLLREFKFSILDDGQNYGSDLQGEKILLQGVVDCALIEDDGITVIDFKTDHVTEQTLTQITEKYERQVITYVKALQKIYQKPVKEAYLYFFSLDRFVAIQL